MHLPELEEGWRWKIDPVFEDAWSIVSVKLQKKHWLFGWLTVRSQGATDMVVASNLDEEVSKTAQNIWDMTWGESPAKKISGVYYGDNQHRKK